MVLQHRGENVLRATEVLKLFEVEIESFKEELETRLKKVPLTIGLRFQGGEDKTDEDDFYSPEGWILLGWCWGYPAKGKRPGGRKTTMLGKLHVVCDIGRPNWPALALGFPCLLVAWSTPNDEWDFGTPEYVWPRSEQCEEIRAGRLFWWLRDSDESDAIAKRNRALHPKIAAWHYVVPLTAISNTDALKGLIIEPAVRLLSGERADEAFDKAPEVLQFRWHQGNSVPTEGT